MWCLPLWLFWKSGKHTCGFFPLLFVHLKAEHQPYDFRLRFITTAIVYDLYACSARGRCGSTVNAKIDCWSLLAKLIYPLWYYSSDLSQAILHNHSFKSSSLQVPPTHYAIFYFSIDWKKLWRPRGNSGKYISFWAKKWLLERSRINHTTP